MTLAGSRPITAPQEGAQRKQDQIIIDCDVHQTYSSPDELIPFLPGVYREIVSNQGVLVPASGYFNAPKRAARTDLAEDPNPRADYNGRHQGYDYDNLRGKSSGPLEHRLRSVDWEQVRRLGYPRRRLRRRFLPSEQRLDPRNLGLPRPKIQNGDDRFNGRSSVGGTGDRSTRRAARNRRTDSAYRIAYSLR